MFTEKNPPQTEEINRILQRLDKYLVAVDVTFEDYYENYAHDRHEWVEGMVYKLSPASLTHNDLIGFLFMLFNEFFHRKSLGRVIQSPFIMKLEGISAREPDLMIVLNEHANNLSDTMMNGPADICIEIVSPESPERDYGTKFTEYEKGGVREYWIFDPRHKDARFYRLDEDGVYQSQSVDSDGNYQTPLLDKFRLHVSMLWTAPLPSPSGIVKQVQAMFK